MQALRSSHTSLSTSATVTTTSSVPTVFLGVGGLHRHTVHVVDMCVRAELVVERRIEGQHSGDANGEASGASQ